MLNTFPITEVRRPIYVYGRAYNTSASICLLNNNGNIHSSKSLNVGDSFPFIQDIDNDDFIVGATTGTKYAYYAPTAQRYPKSGSWSTNGDGGPAGYSSRNNRIYFFRNSSSFNPSISGSTYEYKYSTIEKTGSSIIELAMNWPNPKLQLGNNETSTYAKGKIFIGSQAGNNSIGGVILVNIPETTSSYYLNCSGSLVNSRVSGPAYDPRRNIIWSYNGTEKSLIAHDFDTGVIVESRSWNLINDSSSLCNNGIYISQLNEIWIAGFSFNNVQIYNLTTNISRSILSTDMGLVSWSLDPDPIKSPTGGIYSIASGGGNQKIQ